jgi:hypothetical protein
LNWEQIRANWGLFKRRIGLRWHRFTEVQLNAIGGQRPQLVRGIVDLYQLSADDAERQVADWQARQRMDTPA